MVAGGNEDEGGEDEGEGGEGCGVEDAKEGDTGVGKVHGKDISVGCMIIGIMMLANGNTLTNIRKSPRCHLVRW